MSVKQVKRAPRKARVYRKRPVVSGRGAYAVRPYRKKRMPIRRYAKGHGGYGARIGERIGSVAGSFLGDKAQELIKYITGFGGYKITTNSLMGGLYDPPELHNRGRDTVVICHREYIMDITAASSFTLTSLAIQPGLVTTFPWLSSIAESFEEYRITGMIFEYKTLSADYTSASSAALGFVIMASQYNVYNPPFPDKKTMENYEFSNSAKPSDTFIHPIECKRALNPVGEMYVRTGAVTQGDLRLYDLANFQIATGGNSGSGILGELWVTFEVEFYKPKLVSALGYELLSDHWQLPTTGVSGSAPFGTVGTAAPELVLGSNLGTTITAAPGSVYRFLVWPNNISDGLYLVVITWLGTAAAITQPLTVPTNCTLQSYWYNDTVSNIGPTTGTTTNVLTLSYLVKITAMAASINFGVAGTLPTTVTNGDIWVTQVNGNIAS